MFTKEDLYIYDLPGNQKEIFIFPRLLGGSNYFSYLRMFKCRGLKIKNNWEIKTPGYLSWFLTSERMSVYTVLRFINNPAKSAVLYKDLIHHCFNSRDL